jgi:hypothetical protein
MAWTKPDFTCCPAAEIDRALEAFARFARAKQDDVRLCLHHAIAHASGPQKNFRAMLNPMNQSSWLLPWAN